MRILDFTYHDDAVQTSYAVDVSQGVEHEVLIGFHIPGIYLNLEVIIAGGVVALRYLVDGLHGIHELLNQIVGVLLEPDIAEHDYVVPQLVMVYNAPYRWMYPSRSSRFCRSKVGEGERCTLAASSFTVSREFCCSNFSILMSVSSSFSSVVIVSLFLFLLILTE